MVSFQPGPDAEDQNLGSVRLPPDGPQMSANPLLRREFPIPFDLIKPEHIPSAVRELIRQGNAGMTAIASLEEPRTFQNTVLAIDRLAIRLTEVWNTVKQLQDTVSTPALEAAISEVEAEKARFTSGIYLSQGLWRAIKEYSQSPESQSLEPVQRRLLERLTESFRLAGADLEEPVRMRLSEIEGKLAELGSTFKNNLSTASKSAQILLDEPPRGVPEGALEIARQNAAEKGLPGKYLFGTDEFSCDSILRFAEDAALRESMFRAFHSRALGGSLDNMKVASDELELRREKAAILKTAGIDGRESFADFQLALRMAGGGAGAMAMMEKIAGRVQPVFERETAELLAFKREATGDPAAELRAWDIAFYSEKLRASRHGFDEKEVMQYFPLEKVLSGLFKVAEDLYGIRIEANPRIPAWHPDVRRFNIFDNDGTHLGSFYMDLYSREGSKSQGAWVETLHRRCPGLEGHDKYLGILACNFAPPTETAPTLLRHSDVETLFHEFGHMLHAFFTSSPYASLADMPWDAVELPSQLMENWGWDKGILRSISSHYRSQDPLPDDLFEKMHAARNFRQGSVITWLLRYSLLDLKLHMDYTPERDGDLAGFSRKFLEPFTPGKMEDYDIRLNRFLHLFAGEYAAGYYSYLWALVLACDAYSRFEKEGLLNRATGEDFRQKVLNPGESVELLEAYNQFMRRHPKAPPDIDALFKVFGLEH